MKKLIAGAAALAIAAAAMPALAADLIYYAPADSLTEGLDGQAYWSTQAQCAGLFGASAQYFSSEGDTADAEQAASHAKAFANDAIKRLMKDRGITRKEALLSIEPVVLKGRDDGITLIAAGTTSSNSTWNYARSSCLDVADAYTQVNY